MTKGLHKNSLRKVDNPHQWMIDDAGMELIQQIKAEIERLKGICTTQIKANPGQTFPFVMEMTGYDKLLTFLDTLEEEPVELHDEIAKMWANTCHLNKKKDQRIATLDSIEFCEFARHFAKWGAEHRSSSEKPKIPTNLEEAARLYSIPRYMKDVDKEHIEEYPYNKVDEIAFKAGAMWAMEQGVSTEGVARRKYDHQYGLRSILEFDESAMVNQLIPQDFKAKVIIQIRKKDE